MSIRDELLWWRSQYLPTRLPSRRTSLGIVGVIIFVAAVVWARVNSNLPACTTARTQLAEVERRMVMARDDGLEPAPDDLDEQQRLRSILEIHCQRGTYSGEYGRW